MSISIIQPAYAWAKELVKRTATECIILHNRGGWGDVGSIHRDHIDRCGYAGIGYNFYVRFDGSVFAGRPIDVRGAHAEFNNWNSIGICAEGYYEEPPANSNIPLDKVNRIMPDAQKSAIIELIAYCRQFYPGIPTKKHSDVNETSCPGQYYPYAEITGGGVKPVEKWEQDAVDNAFATGLITQKVDPRATPTCAWVLVIALRLLKRIVG